MTAPSSSESPAGELQVTWADYHANIEQLAVLIYQSGWQFDGILCLARGGLRVGDILSRLFRCPLAILSVASYTGDDGKVRGSLTLSRNISMTAPHLGRRLLLVDDLVDSGVTLAQTLVWLQQYEEFAIEEIRTATIWYKARSTIAPDYYAVYLPDNPWIRQPFERYDRITPAELAAQRQQATQS